MLENLCNIPEDRRHQKPQLKLLGKTGNADL
jgi:hypothetical protein